MDVQVDRALPAEYLIVINNMPQGWFGPDGPLLFLQVAEMIKSNHFLIAHTGEQLVGGLGWQDDVAFGAIYEKFLFVKPEYRKQGIAALLWRELVKIAVADGRRTIFCDVPEGSALVRAVKQVPGAREAGGIDNFHSDGVRSLIFSLDLKNTDRFFHYVDRIVASSNDQKEHGHAS